MNTSSIPKDKVSSNGLKSKIIDNVPGFNTSAKESTVFYEI